MSIDVALIQSRKISLTGIFRYANTCPTALGLIAGRAVDVDAVITHRFDPAHTEEALTIGRRDLLALTVVVAPGH